MKRKIVSVRLSLLYIGILITEAVISTQNQTWVTSLTNYTLPLSPSLSLPLFLSLFLYFCSTGLSSESDATTRRKWWKSNPGRFQWKVLSSHSRGCRVRKTYTWICDAFTRWSSHSPQGWCFWGSPGSTGLYVWFSDQFNDLPQWPSSKKGSTTFRFQCTIFDGFHVQVCRRNEWPQTYRSWTWTVLCRGCHRTWYVSLFPSLYILWPWGNCAFPFPWFIWLDCHAKRK